MDNIKGAKSVWHVCTEGLQTQKNRGSPQTEDSIRDKNTTACTTKQFRETQKRYLARE